jgi:hypothetical protein
MPHRPVKAEPRGVSPADFFGSLGDDKSEFRHFCSLLTQKALFNNMPEDVHGWVRCRGKLVIPENCLIYRDSHSGIWLMNVTLGA